MGAGGEVDHGLSRERSEAQCALERAGGEVYPRLSGKRVNRDTPPG
jgi:hypothetical protein